MTKDLSTNISIPAIVPALNSHTKPVRDTEDDDAKDDEPHGLHASKIVIMEQLEMRTILVSSGYRRGGQGGQWPDQGGAAGAGEAEVWHGEVDGWVDRFSLQERSNRAG